MEEVKGGSTAAYELARRGAKVGLFEQKHLPRYKPCGGCLALKIDQILEPDFHPLVEKTVYGATFTFEGIDEFAVKSDRPIAYMVMRDRFDHFLAQKAQGAGADLLQGERVLDVADFPIIRNWYIVKRRGKRLSPAAEAFRRFVVDEAERFIRLPGREG